MDRQNKRTETTIGIIGLGYVGLPLALLCVEKGLNVFGIEVDERKIELLHQRKSYLSDITNSEIEKAMNTQRIQVTNNYSHLAEVNCIIICVPTPLEENIPNLSYVIDSVKEIRKYLQNGQVIILESSTFPGTTEEIVLPILEESSLMEGKDFFLAYSPERIDPGNHSHKLNNIVKIVGGVSLESGEKAKSYYDQLFDHIHLVSSSKVAEMAKILENTYRFINISLINEMTILCDQIGLDIWEVIHAAKTKPYGFQAFYPGPGIGGHCIPIDPIYLNWKLEQIGLSSEFIKLAKIMNQNMIHYNINEIYNIIASTSEHQSPTLLIYGVTYKPNVNDIRHSPAIEMIEEWSKRNVKVLYHDPYVDEIQLNGKKMINQNISKELLNTVDAVVILSNHDQLPRELLLNHSSLIFDTRNALEGHEGNAKVIKLGSYHNNKN
ncbi:nucleotide sugar dehydrogenase [Bacillus salitolerans]|uniref:Nucleotide sugar dehydrogenase n=1 Tax=Bacillus salitolerans TaxID=1437434 RepID=A0ABW4LJS5_9BACI